MVVEEAEDLSLPVEMGVEEPAASAKDRPQEVSGAGGGVHVVPATERRARLGKGADRVPVPGDERLVVTERRLSAAAYDE